MGIKMVNHEKHWEITRCRWQAISKANPYWKVDFQDCGPQSMGIPQVLAIVGAKVLKFLRLRQGTHHKQ